MSTLTKTYLDIFRNFFPREHPSTNNIVIFLRYYYFRLRDQLPIDSTKTFIPFLDLVRSAASKDHDFPLSSLESHPVSGRGSTKTFLLFQIVSANTNSSASGSLSFCWGLPGRKLCNCGRTFGLVVVPEIDICSGGSKQGRKRH